MENGKEEYFFTVRDRDGAVIAFDAAVAQYKDVALYPLYRDAVDPENYSG